MESWNEIAVDGKVTFPFPTDPLEITFGLADVNAPDPVTVTFTPPDAQFLSDTVSSLSAAVSERALEADQIVRGLGGNPALDAIKAIYRDEIAAQKNIEGLIQHYMDAAVRGRYRMEILRQMAAQITGV